MKKNIGKKLTKKDVKGEYNLNIDIKNSLPIKCCENHEIIKGVSVCGLCYNGNHCENCPKQDWESRFDERLVGLKRDIKKLKETIKLLK